MATLLIAESSLNSRKQIVLSQVTWSYAKCMPVATWAKLESSITIYIVEHGFAFVYLCHLLSML